MGKSKTTYNTGAYAMKITKTRLKELIKEELTDVRRTNLNEQEEEVLASPADKPVQMEPETSDVAKLIKLAGAVLPKIDNTKELKDFLAVIFGPSGLDPALLRKNKQILRNVFTNILKSA